MTARQDEAKEVVATIREWAGELYQQYEATDDNKFLHAATDMMSAADDVAHAMGVEE